MVGWLFRPAAIPLIKFYLYLYAAWCLGRHYEWQGIALWFAGFLAPIAYDTLAEWREGVGSAGRLR
jgi:hypothetical protein